MPSSGATAPEVPAGRHPGGAMFRRGPRQRRLCHLVVGILTTFATTVGVTAPWADAVAAANIATAGGQQPSGSPPGVVPALQQWAGASGTFQLGPQSRIVVDATTVSGEAATLHDDLAALTGLTLPVVVKAKPRPGDVFLSA